MMTVKQVATRLGISVALVYIWCDQGLAHYRLGRKGSRGSIRVSEDDLEAFLATLKCETRPAVSSPPASKVSKLAFRHLKIR
jgi:excisionase family DNA binding protein